MGDRYNSPSRQPGLLKDRGSTPTSQSALLKQELLALGPRPMTSMSMGTGPHRQDLEPPPHDGGGGLGPVVGPVGIASTGTANSYGSGTPLLRPPGYIENNASMYPEFKPERKAENHGLNRRCCGP